jgi:hypothetical protein
MGIGYIDQLNVNEFSGNSITAQTLFLSGQNITNYFNISGGGNSTYVQNGLNTYTGGTALNPTINISAGTFSFLSAGTLSGGTILSGGTDLNEIFLKNKTFLAGENLIVSQSGNNITYSLSGNIHLVNILADDIITETETVNKYIYAGAGANQIGINGLTGELNAPNFISGSTNLNDIFAGINHTHSFSALTNTAHTHSISEVTNLATQLDNKANITGNSSFVSTIVSATTLFSGDTNIQNLFVGSGITSGGGNSVFIGKTNNNLLFKSFSGINISISDDGGLLTFSAGTGGVGSTTNIQDGLNTFTGGTSSNPTVNISAATLNSLNVSSLIVSSTTIFQGAIQTNSFINSYSALRFQYTSTTPQIYWDGDTGTGLNFDGNKNFSIHTNGAYRLFLTSGGTVAVNYTPDFTESYKFIVSGSSYFTDGITASSISVNSASVTMLYGGTILSGNTNIQNLFESKLLTGTTKINFGKENGGELDFATTAITNSNITENSMILMKLSTSLDHPNVEELLIESVSLRESDLIAQSGFTINAYSECGTWGEYNIVYKIIN